MSEEMLDFLDRIPDGILTGDIVCDEEGLPCDSRVRYVNSAFEKLAGCKSEEILDRGLSDIALVRPNFPGLGMDRQIIFENAAFRKGTGGFDYYSENTSSSYSVSVIPVNPKAFTCIFRQMSQELVNEDIETLRRSEGRFRTLAEITSDSASSLTLMPDGSFHRDWVTDKLLRTFGYTFSDIDTFEKWGSIIYPEDLPRYREAIAKLQKGEKAVGEFRIVTRDGTLRWIENTVYPRKDPETGKPVGLFSAVRDIHDRKMAEQKLLFTQFTLDHAPDMVFWIDKDGRFVYTNEAVTDKLGYSLSEMQGMNILDIDVWLTPAARLKRWEHLSRGASDIFESEYRTRSGSLLPVEVNCNLFSFEENSYSISYIRDITLRRKTDENLQKSQRLESLGILAGGIAHDFNNLLTGIFGYIDIARMLLPAGHPALEPLAKSAEIYHRARDLSNQLLTFSRGGISEKRKLPLGPIVMEDTRFALSGSHVSVEFNIAPDLWPCEVSRNQLDQVIDNIVINAKQASGKNGRLSVSARNVIIDRGRPVPEGRYVRIEFLDNGPGIRPEVISQVFDPFFTTKKTGNGLGLAISYSIVKKHGGMIEAFSRPGEGASFVIHLPAAE
jgi:PAS domain S-box-containing protein